MNQPAPASAGAYHSIVHPPSHVFDWNTMITGIHGSTRIHRTCLLPALVLLGGCITGNEAQEAMEPDPQREMIDLQMDHDIGVISDVEYESKREQLLEEE